MERERRDRSKERKDRREKVDAHSRRDERDQKGGDRERQRLVKKNLLIFCVLTNIFLYLVE